MTGCSDGLVRVFQIRTGQCIKYVVYIACIQANVLSRIFGLGGGGGRGEL